MGLLPFLNATSKIPWKEIIAAAVVIGEAIKELKAHFHNKKQPSKELQLVQAMGEQQARLVKIVKILEARVAVLTWALAITWLAIIIGWVWK